MKLDEDRELAAGAMGNSAERTSKEDVTRAIRRAREDVAQMERGLAAAETHLRALLRLHLTDHGPEVDLGDQVMTIRTRGEAHYLYPKRPGAK